MISRRYVCVEDHAFASGPVFARPASVLHAIAAARSIGSGFRIAAVWRQFVSAAVVMPGVRLSARARLVNRNAREAAHIGENCALRGAIRLERAGRLELGQFVYVGDDTVISAASEVCIGDFTLLAHNVQIFDNDTHPTDAAGRRAHFMSLLGTPPAVEIRIESLPVRIGSGCWIGMNSLVMKGVEIGDETIVAAGSVVTKSLPARVLAAGNPAVPIKSIE